MKRSGLRVGYHHVFTYMEKVAQGSGLHVTRSNVLNILPNQLSKIRQRAFLNIQSELDKSQNMIDFVSTPGTFRVKPSPNFSSGKITGLQANDIHRIDPDLVIIFIADLLHVKRSLESDQDWSDRVGHNLRTLAEWRSESIELIRKDAENWRLKTRRSLLDYTIFAGAHDPQTLIDLCLGKKPRIYISFAITGAKQSEIDKVTEIRSKLQKHFVCFDPRAIKDWELINNYDKAIQARKPLVRFYHTKTTLTTSEVQDAIDDIRSQTVDRDLLLVERSHATVVLHTSKTPSYGVMAEVIHTSKVAGNPNYALYPFKTRPSPFFEHYVSSENIIRGEDIDSSTSKLIRKMKLDIRKGRWLRWPANSKDISKN